MIHKILFAFILVFGLTVAASAQGEVNLSGSVGNGKLMRGKAAQVTVVMSIPGNLHVNSNRPLSKYAIPTRITATAAGLTVGAVKYPAGTNRKFSFSEDTISVYEGTKSFTFNVTVPQNFKGNVAKIRVVVKYQSCTDEVCYPPKNGEFTLSASVK